MGGRSKAAPRCVRCRLHEDLCACHLAPPLNLRTRVEVLMHKREVVKTTATAPWLALAVPTCTLHLRGLPNESLDLSAALGPERRGLFLFPAEDARPLDAALVAEDPRPITLIVPDGNWRQASKVHRREPLLSGLQTVVLADPRPTRYQLRNEPKEGGLATFEAIARALGVIEGEAVAEALEAFFAELVARTLITRPPRVRDPGATDGS